MMYSFLGLYLLVVQPGVNILVKSTLNRFENGYVLMGDAKKVRITNNFKDILFIKF